MTFCIEAVDAQGMRTPVWIALLMGLSTVCGLILPFCANVWVWLAVVAFSFATYLPIMARMHDKVMACRRLPDARSADEMERVLRMRIGRDLIKSCAVMWTSVSYTHLTLPTTPYV